MFQCHFTPVNDTNIVYYKVFWFVNDHTSTIFASQAVPKDRLPESYLRGETGLNLIKLNIEVYVAIVFIHCFTLTIIPYVIRCSNH